MAFLDVSFNGGANFTTVTFNRNVVFLAKFSGADFSQARFNGQAFFQAKFTTSVFNRASFINEAIFIADFEVANFSATDFGGKAFINGTFTNNANFSKANFNGIVDFSGSTFGPKSIVNFSSALFNADADFSGVEFNGEVNFSDVEFNSRSDFSETEFRKRADFSFGKFFQAQFASTKLKKAYFVGAEFQKARFISVNVSGEANFHLAKFGEVYFFKNSCAKTDFSGARFEKAYFYQMVFRDEVDFYQASLEEVNFSNIQFKGETRFRFVLFKDGEKTLFDVEDMSNVSFLNTDITRVRFGEKIRWGKNDKFEVIDENKLVAEIEGSRSKQVMDLGIIKVHFKNFRAKLYGNSRIMERNELECPNVRLNGVITIYRNLKENYEHSLRFEEADRFFIREMELKRRFRETSKGDSYVIRGNGWLRRNLSLTGLYYHISEYGLNYKRPLLIAIAFLLGQILYSLWQANPLFQPSLTYQGLSQTLNTTGQTLSNTFQIESENIGDFFVKFLTIPVLGALAIAALKRTFEKKLGH